MKEPDNQPGAKDDADTAIPLHPDLQDRIVDGGEHGISIIHPLLIVHGSLDIPARADETFVALRRLGKEVEYARYDGEQHWTDPARHAEDIERLEFLAAKGWVIVRVSARQLRYQQALVVERVRTALQRAGFPR